MSNVPDFFGNPMAAQVKPSILDVPDAEQCLMQHKFDGFRAMFRTNDVGEVTCLTRNGKDQSGKLVRIEAQLAAVLPRNTTVDCEITAFQVNDSGTEVDARFDVVQSVMLSKHDRARELQKDAGISLALFDLLELEGAILIDDPLVDRIKKLDAFTTPLEEYNGGKEIFVAPCLDATQENHETIVGFGWEGTVVKDMYSGYLPGQRGHGWYKLKPQTEDDVIVTGSKEGKGKFKGLVGALEFSQYISTGHNEWELRHVGSCSGMTDEQRAEVTKLAEAGLLVGRVMEIKHHGKSTTGEKFRHPQFSRWREDKPQSECTDNGEKVQENHVIVLPAGSEI